MLARRKQERKILVMRMLGDDGGMLVVAMMLKFL